MSPVVRTILDQLGERLSEFHESAICASEPIPKHLAETLISYSRKECLNPGENSHREAQSNLPFSLAFSANAGVVVGV